jgi:glutamate decarboxylase
LASALQIMGTQGYGLLIEHGIDTARNFAAEITRRPMFELISAPQLNILTYRVCPPQYQSALKTADVTARRKINKALNAINHRIQVQQREAGNSFVSRTTLYKHNSKSDPVVVLRAVIMNPLTNMDILKEILDEQEERYRKHYG